MPDRLSPRRNDSESLYACRDTGRWALLEELLEAWAVGAKPPHFANLAGRLVRLEAERAARGDVVIPLRERLRERAARRAQRGVGKA